MGLGLMTLITACVCGNMIYSIKGPSTNRGISWLPKVQGCKASQVSLHCADVVD